MDTSKIKRIAVLGANADSIDMLLGNYNGTPSHPVTILQGIKTAAAPLAKVDYAKGCPIALEHGKSFAEDSSEYKSALTTATNADMIVYVGGLTPNLEGEEMPVNADGFSGGDRTQIELPTVQARFIKALYKTGKPVVFVNCSGSAIAMPWEAEHLAAIVEAWYPGRAGGTAVADVLFGKYNPAGRLPVTFYRSTLDLPEFEDYRMKNRTYRFFKGMPLWAFGYGLSYTTFRYDNLAIAQSELHKDGKLDLTVDVSNTGTRDGEEVVQLYVSREIPAPIFRCAICEHSNECRSR